MFEIEASHRRFRRKHTPRALVGPRRGGYPPLRTNAENRGLTIALRRREPYVSLKLFPRIRGRHTRTRDRPYHQPPLPLPLSLAIFHPDYWGGSSVPEVTVKIAMQPKARKSAQASGHPHHQSWPSGRASPARQRPHNSPVSPDRLAPSLISRSESDEPERIDRRYTPENRHPPLEVESEKGEMAE
jgi:hypothetical protein